MKSLLTAPGAALAALFLVGGCSGAPRNSVASAPAQNGVDLARIELPRPPAIPDEVSEAEATPLNDAGEIASEISSNTMIERVPVEGGLAWRQDGEVMRTVSRDGARVAYFRPGEERPFFVQRGGLAYALENGQAQLAYDSEGHPAPVSAVARAEAARLADQARRERDEAERAAVAAPAAAADSAE